MNSTYRLAFLSAMMGALCVVGGVSAQERVKDDVNVDSGHSYRAKEVLGSKVQIEGDRSVGTVEDIVLDEHGNVDYLIVLTSEKSLVSVPWDAATFNPKQRVASVKITQDRFEKIPTYTAEKYPTFSNPEYRTTTYKAYGVTPGQVRRAIRRGVVNP